MSGITASKARVVNFIASLSAPNVLVIVVEQLRAVLTWVAATRDLARSADLILQAAVLRLRALTWRREPSG